MTQPLLERDYVEFLLERLRQEGHCNLPTQDIAEQLVRAVNSKPGELARALMQLEKSPLRAVASRNVTCSIWPFSQTQ